MEKISRAIILAAGYGSRLEPVSKNVPKPLIRVNGIVMIESIIESLLDAGIKDIIIVVGYLKEQFIYLNKKYNVKLIENKFYNKSNNISSLFSCKDFLDKASYIIEGDQIIYNKDIFKSNNVKNSGYFVHKICSFSKEWILEVEKNKIVNCYKNGNDKGWELHGVSKWNANDLKKIKSFLEKYFYDYSNVFWDEIALVLKKEDFNLTIFEINKDDLVEIDTYDELRRIDSSYE